MTTASLVLVLLLAAVTALVVALPLVFAARRTAEAARAAGLVALLVALLVVALAAPRADVAFVAAAAALLVTALAARSRDARAGLALAAVVSAAVAGALAVGQGEVALVGSLVAIALRIGVAPMHGPVAALGRSQPALLIELVGGAVVAAWLHVRWAVPAAPALAHTLAVPLVAWGAGAALFGALLSLVAPSLRRLWTASFVMHAGMLWAALGAAGRGHLVAALLVAVTLALAQGGFGAMVVALEERTGPVLLRGPGGRVRAFPTVTACFAFFAGAGVGLPGTAGFIADDLLLHALWEEGAAAAVVVIVASALLAIGLLRGFGAAFLGPAERTWRAGDLDVVERAAAVAAIVFLCVIGAVPMLLVGPAAEVAALAVLIHTPPSTVPNPVGARPSSAPTTGHAGESRHAKAD